MTLFCFHVNNRGLSDWIFPLFCRPRTKKLTLTDVRASEPKSEFTGLKSKQKRIRRGSWSKSPSGRSIRPPHKILGNPQKKMNLQTHQEIDCNVGLSRKRRFLPIYESLNSSSVFISSQTLTVLQNASSLHPLQSIQGSLPRGGGRGTGGGSATPLGFWTRPRTFPRTILIPQTLTPSQEPPLPLGLQRDLGPGDVAEGPRPHDLQPLLQGQLGTRPDPLHNVKKPRLRAESTSIDARISGGHQRGRTRVGGRPWVVEAELLPSEERRGREGVGVTSAKQWATSLLEAVITRPKLVQTCERHLDFLNPLKFSWWPTQKWLKSHPFYDSWSLLLQHTKGLDHETLLLRSSSIHRIKFLLVNPAFFCLEDANQKSRIKRLLFAH